MSGIEYGVRIFDSAPGQGERIEPVGNLARAQHRRGYFLAINKTRRTYGVAASVVCRIEDGDWMPWSEA
jgi:hypothetical protein